MRHYKVVTGKNGEGVVHIDKPRRKIKVQGDERTDRRADGRSCMWIAHDADQRLRSNASTKTVVVVVRAMLPSIEPQRSLRDLPLEQPGSSNEIDLNFEGMQLERVPQRNPITDEEYNPAEIRRLNLSKNNILHLSCLPAFKNLVSLDVSNNSLSVLSEDIGALTQLRTFSARNNLLEDLPKSMNKLDQMEALYLSGNRFEIVPLAVLKMCRLRILHLGGNRIESVPYDIGCLIKLEILYLGGNLLRDVPATIGRLQRLSSLSLCDNQLETIPSTFGELRNLENLSLHNNVLRTLPTEIVKLRNLQQLSLRQNPLVNHFVHNMQLAPPKLKELAGRLVRLKMSRLPINDVLPRELIAYLNSANQCVNPKCKGVYFEACVEHVKFVDFCGKYRVPLLQFLCSPKCSATVPAYSSSESSSDTDDDLPNNMKMRKILLG